MKKLIICVTIFVASIFGTQAWATAIYYEPFVSAIELGESLDVDVMIAGLACDTDVGAFEFNVLFDDAILAFDSYSLSDNLGDVSAVDALDMSMGDLGGGAVNLYEVSMLWDLSFQPDSFALSTLYFTGIGAGVSPLTFDLPEPYYISDAWGNSICAVPLPGMVKVCDTAPVPEPSTILLFGAGLAVFSIRLIRKRNNA